MVFTFLHLATSIHKNKLSIANRQNYSFLTFISERKEANTSNHLLNNMSAPEARDTWVKICYPNNNEQLELEGNPHFQSFFHLDIFLQTQNYTLKPKKPIK
jgi:hypothetical protein